jgi:aminomethyltransferase
VKIVRDDVNSLPLFRIWHEPDRSQQLWETLVHAGATEAGCEAEELLRIASGTPQFGVDLLERDLPQETGQQRALHFSKGCYIGQEIVERIHSRGNVHRGWRGFVADSPLSVGAKAESEGKEIGTLTSVATLPFESGNVHVGLGIVRLQAVEQGKPLLAAGASVEPATLPFLKI